MSSSSVWARSRVSSPSHSSNPLQSGTEDLDYEKITMQNFAAAKREAKRQVQRGHDLDEHMALVDQFGWKINKSKYLYFWNPFWSNRDEEDEGIVILCRQISREKLENGGGGDGCEIMLV